MPQPKNSILSDPTPYQLPEPNQPAKKIPQTDWDKLGKSRNYKEVDAYLLVREEYWRHFLPDGTAFKDLAARDAQAAGVWGGAASAIIEEIENIRYRINQPKRK